MRKEPKKIAFTKRSLEALESPEKGRVYVYDTRQDNLALCITASGSTTFYRVGRVAGKPARIKLGRFPDMSVENARKAARAISGDIAKDVDPRRKKRKGTTLEDVFQHWLTHAKRRKKSWPEDVQKWNFHFRPLRNKRLEEITPAMVSKWHGTIGETRGTVTANRASALLSTIYNVAHELGYDGPNPCRGVRRFPETSRERFLQPHELRPFFEAVKQEPDKYRDFWLLCLFSGARRGNVGAMEWDNLDLERGLWYLSGDQVKNKKPVVVILPPQAVAILEARAADRNGSPYVFPANTSTGYMVDPRKSWKRLINRSGIADLHPHDLRRSLGSWQALGGSSLQIIGASLGHADIKSTQIYSRLLLDPVRNSVNGAVQKMLEAADATPDDHAE